MGRQKAERVAIKKSLPEDPGSDLNLFVAEDSRPEHSFMLNRDNVSADKRALLTVAVRGEVSLRAERS